MTVLSGRWRISQGDSLELLRALPDACVDSIVTDPPYGLSQHHPRDITDALTAWLAGDPYRPRKRGFMGRSWDAFVPGPELWRECYRVLKPGGHLLAFAGSRTFDLMGIAIRLAGFDVRDTIEWMYGSGFPKSLNISLAIDKAAGVEVQREVVHTYTAAGNAGTSTAEKGGTYVVGAENSAPVQLTVTRGATPKSQAWDGWGTALKPAHEPILVARKPIEGTLIANVLEHGTGGLNIDACRVATDWDEPDRPESWRQSGHSADPDAEKIAAPPGDGIQCHPGGRFPPNVVFSHADGCSGDACLESCPVADLGRQSGESVSSDAVRNNSAHAHNQTSSMGASANDWTSTGFADSGTAARFFPCFRYEPKASTAEREAGCEALPIRTAGELTGRQDGSAGLTPRAGAGRASKGRRNTHPTVKPLALMRWLVRLVTPPNGIVLDPFAGSGTTVCAALMERCRCIGLELDAEHVAIAEARARHWERSDEARQMNLFDLLTG